MRKLYTLAMMALMLAVNSCNNNQAKDVEETATAKKDNANTAVTKTILFFGNSLTAGYGLDVTEAFPALIQARLDSLKLPQEVKPGSAGCCGKTWTSSCWN